MFRFGFSFLPLLVIVAVVVAAVRARGASRQSPDRPVVDTTGRSRPEGPSPTAPPPPTTLTGTSSSALAALDRWVAAGLVSPEQAAAIRAAEAPTVVGPTVEPVRRRVPVVAEALGYLGGVLGIVGFSIFIARFWSDLGVGGRLATSLGGTTAFVVGGALVREQSEASLARLRGFLWLAATAAAGVAGGVVARDLFDSETTDTTAFAVAVAVTLVGAALWGLRDRPAQAVSTLVGVLVATATGVSDISSLPWAGLAVLAVAGLIAATGLVRLGPIPWIATVIGAGGSLVGAAMTIEDWRGPGLLIATAVAVGVASLTQLRPLRLLPHERVLLYVLAAVALMQLIPNVITYFADDAGIVTGLAMWLSGVALVAIAARRLVRTPVLVEIAGGLVLVGGAAVTGFRAVGFATIFGLVTAVALLVVGMFPGRVLMSVFGSLGLLVNVPWSVQHFFPGEDRAPLLIAVSGLLLVAVAVLLTRLGGRFRSELGN